ncbi:hypothetical protein ACFC34_36140 [Streptomyces sp. NPDC056053]|uniref:hypothetical protein n=1 Tax=Streptomyces sp. NPDC056053 TaxID=3345696 RepID=UPI0035D75320
MMAVFTPYMLRTEPTWQAAAWLVMLTATVTGLATPIRAELLFRGLERDSRSAVAET